MDGWVGVGSILLFLSFVLFSFSISSRFSFLYLFLILLFSFFFFLPPPFGGWAAVLCALGLDILCSYSLSSPPSLIEKRLVLALFTSM